MTPFVLRTLSKIDDLLLAETRGAPERHRRERLGLSCVGVFLTQVPVFIAVYPGFRVYSAAIIVVAIGAAFLLTPRVMRRALNLGNHYVIAMLLAGLLGITACTGGPAAPALWWTYAVPVMAMMPLGPRAGAGWLGVTLACTVGVHAASALGVPFTHAMLGWQTRLLGAIGASMLALVLFALASSYESVRAAMLSSLDRANDDMRLVLDNVEQGFVTVGRGGARVGMASAVVSRWFGPPHGDETLPDWIAHHPPSIGAWLRLGIDVVFEDVLPREVTLAQLPRRFSVGAHTFDLDYRPVVGESDALRALVVIVSDATERVKAERAEAAQRELLAMVHAVRNAVDPGGEDPDTRAAAGKCPTMRLTFDCAVDDTGVRVSLSDDGRGIDWDAVAARAAARGLSSDTEADLVAALFADGVSTRTTVTEFSGRGVGLGALRDACASIGAELGVRSVRGEGTRIEVLAPHTTVSAVSKAA